MSSDPKERANSTGAKAAVSQSGTSRKSTKKSSWIAPDDDWMRSSRIDRVHPITEFVQCGVDDVPLLRVQVSANVKMTRPTEFLSHDPLCSPHPVPIKTEDSQPGHSGFDMLMPKYELVIPESNGDSEEATAHSYSTEDDTNLWNRRIPKTEVKEEEGEEAANLSTGNSSPSSNGDPGNEDLTKVKTEGPPVNRTKQRKKREALEYAKNWRLKLEADRPTKVLKTCMPYTKAEQKKIVDYLLTFDDVRLAAPKGLKIWRKMLMEGILPHRTAQSLQNHFVKSLLPNIALFFDEMSEAHRKQFRDLQIGSRK